MRLRGSDGYAMRAATLAVAALLCACQPQRAPTVTTAGAAPGTAQGGDQRLSGFAVPDPVEPWSEEEPPAELAAIPADLGADPSKLRGLSAPLLHAALGVPSFRRRDRSSEIWQYYGDGCVLDLFLYEEVGLKRVAHYAVRSRVPGETAPAGCLGAIIAKPRPRGG
jgi:hypothetical protein